MLSTEDSILDQLTYNPYPMLSTEDSIFDQLTYNPYPTFTHGFG